MSARRPRGGMSVTAASRAKRARVQNLCTYHTRREVRNDGVVETVEKWRGAGESWSARRHCFEGGRFEWLIRNGV